MRRFNTIISETKNLRSRFRFTFKDQELDFTDDLYEPPAKCRPNLLRRIQMMKDFSYIRNLQAKKFIHLKLVVLSEYIDTEIFFDFIQLFNIESLEVDMSFANQHCCSNYQMNLRDLLATQPNLKHLCVEGSSRYWWIGGDLFSHNLAHLSNSEKNFFQLESLTYFRSNKIFEGFDEDSDDDGDDGGMDMNTWNVLQTTQFGANFLNLLILNGLHIRALHLEHPMLKAKDYMQLLHNLKLLETLKLALNSIFSEEIDYYALEIKSMQPLKHLKRLELLNDVSMNSTKSQFLKKLLSLSPNLESLKLSRGYYDGSMATWMAKFNKKLIIIEDNGSLIASDIFIESKFSRLKSFKVAKSYFISTYELYDVLSNTAYFLNMNLNVEELNFSVYGTGNSIVTDTNLRLRRFNRDSNKLRRMIFTFTGQTEYLRQIFVKLIGEFTWNEGIVFELRSFKKIPIIIEK